ncbi:MAG TPA: SDR family oxidoreductase [Candidatus Dormibacteraeota bacterium]|nr:SDR family oxidoreductase [Candidatus Dormibacteraeota bacterium]
MGTNRVVIVTGAGGRLGRAMVAGLAEAGARVAALHHRRPPDLEDLQAGSGGGIVHPLWGDVTNEADCCRAVAQTLERFGRVDVLVNNAALTHAAFPRRHRTPLQEVAPDAWRRVIDTNVNGTFLMTRAALPQMLRQRWGRIINVTTSKATMLRATALPYGPSKAAIEAMTLSWARLLAGTGVTVNALLPGGPTGAPAPWERGPGPRWPAEIMIPPIRWLVSPASDGVTGRRFLARLWDPTLPEGAAAAVAGFPAAWPEEPHDAALAPQADRS